MTSQASGLGRGLAVCTLASLLLIRPALSEPYRDFTAGGPALASCGAYIQAAEAEAANRPADASLNVVFTLEYALFLGTAMGFLSGANFADPVHRNVGARSDIPGQMAWLKTFCRQHTLVSFGEALVALRTALEQSDR